MSAGGEPVDRFAAAQSEARRTAVRLGSKAGHDKRTEALARDYADPDSLRRLAGAIKQHTLDHLDVYLEQAQARLEAHGATVHFAADAGEACRTVLGILQRRGARRVVKAKSMATEEVELGAFLAGQGIESVETDLGEFIVQLDADRPSHIVKPIIHKDRREVARTFEGHGLGPYDDTPEVITRRARAHLRRKYLEADAGITGANFVSAESGRLVLVTNEGNSRFCLAATRCHIALVGIEKLVPRDRDLALFLNLLARSATGQTLSVYTEFISGPRRARAGPSHVTTCDALTKSSGWLDGCSVCALAVMPSHPGYATAEAAPALRRGRHNNTHYSSLVCIVESPASGNPLENQDSALPAHSDRCGSSESRSDTARAYRRARSVESVPDNNRSSL